MSIWLLTRGFVLSSRCSKTKSPSQISLYLMEQSVCVYIMTVEGSFLCPLLSEVDEHGMFQIEETTKMFEQTETADSSSEVTQSQSGSVSGQSQDEEDSDLDLSQTESLTQQDSGSTSGQTQTQSSSKSRQKAKSA